MEIRPLDGDRCVLTVASMNGGNVINHFLKIYGMSHQEALDSLDNLDGEEDLPIISPRLFRERGEKDTGVIKEGLVETHNKYTVFGSV